MRAKRRPLLLLVVLMSSTFLGAAPQRRGPLEAKAALRGYFLAVSPKDSKHLGRYARFISVPKPIGVQVRPNQLSLIARPDSFRKFGKYTGFLVILANSTRKELSFAAQDTRLDIVREAQDQRRRWRPIEYLPHSWCGNSYHRLSLPAGQSWSFSAPEYSGPFRTKMRFVLMRQEGNVYSNEFEGAIHPDQFEKKEGNTPTNIMDPYND
jgi:hypothetical protein